MITNSKSSLDSSVESERILRKHTHKCAHRLCNDVDWRFRCYIDQCPDGKIEKDPASVTIRTATPFVRPLKSIFCLKKKSFFYLNDDTIFAVIFSWGIAADAYFVHIWEQNDISTKLAKPLDEHGIELINMFFIHILGSSSNKCIKASLNYS